MKKLTKLFLSLLTLLSLVSCSDKSVNKETRDIINANEKAFSEMTTISFQNNLLISVESNGNSMTMGTVYDTQYDSMSGNIHDTALINYEGLGLKTSIYSDTYYNVENEKLIAYESVGTIDSPGVWIKRDATNEVQSTMALGSHKLISKYINSLTKEDISDKIVYSGELATIDVVELYDSLGLKNNPIILSNTSMFDFKDSKTKVSMEFDINTKVLKSIKLELLSAISDKNAESIIKEGYTTELIINQMNGVVDVVASSEIINTAESIGEELSEPIVDDTVPTAEVENPQNIKTPFEAEVLEIGDETFRFVFNESVYELPKSIISHNELKVNSKIKLIYDGEIIDGVMLDLSKISE